MGTIQDTQKGKDNQTYQVPEKLENNAENSNTISEKQKMWKELYYDMAQPEEDFQKKEAIIWGTQTEKGFINDNALYSELGVIHFSSYIPSSYDGKKPFALFITLPGWEGLYFQGVGANMVEDFGPEAIKYKDEMIILSPQLEDWGETSAKKTIFLTEYFLEHYNIDSSLVYLEGFSGGGETGSLIMGMCPKLYTAYPIVSFKWDGNLEILADARIPVYMAIGEEDSYYGSAPLKEAYQMLYNLYKEQGLSKEEIDKLLVLDVKDSTWFLERQIKDQHSGGRAFAYEESIMGWLFGEYNKI